MKTKLKLQRRLAENLRDILRQGADLLGAIDDALYTKSKESAFADGGSVGGHFRHCLEFVNALLAGIDGGCIDYNKRERNYNVETKREYALAEYLRAIDRLENFAGREQNFLLVKPEDIQEGGEDFWCESSVEREMEFLNSHTIHHYALIGFKLRAAGFVLPLEFGVAPSTLRYWSERKSAAANKS